MAVHLQQFLQGNSANGVADEFHGDVVRFASEYRQNIRGLLWRLVQARFWRTPSIRDSNGFVGRDQMGRQSRVGVHATGHQRHEGRFGVDGGGVCPAERRVDQLHDR